MQQTLGIERAGDPAKGDPCPEGGGGGGQDGRQGVQRARESIAHRERGSGDRDQRQESVELHVAHQARGRQECAHQRGWQEVVLALAEAARTGGQDGENRRDEQDGGREDQGADGHASEEGRRGDSSEIDLAEHPEAPTGQEARGVRDPGHRARHDDRGELPVGQLHPVHRLDQERLERADLTFRCEGLQSRERTPADQHEDRDHREELPDRESGSIGVARDVGAHRDVGQSGVLSEQFFEPGVSETRGLGLDPRTEASSALAARFAGRLEDRDQARTGVVSFSFEREDREIGVEGVEGLLQRRRAVEVIPLAAGGLDLVARWSRGLARVCASQLIQLLFAPLDGLERSDLVTQARGELGRKTSQVGDEARRLRLHAFFGDLPQALAAPEEERVEQDREHDREEQRLAITGQPQELALRDESDQSGSLHAGARSACSTKARKTSSR